MNIMFAEHHDNQKRYIKLCESHLRLKTAQRSTREAVQMPDNEAKLVAQIARLM